MAARFNIDPSLDVDPVRVREYVAVHMLPGEQVRVAPDVRFVGESVEDAAARRAAFGDMPLTVAEFRLDRTDGGARLHYRFEGVEGLHNAIGFTNADGYEQPYGTLIHRDGETWFVPMDGKGAVTGDARRIAETMTRCGHYHFGLPDATLAEYGYEAPEGRTVEAFLAEHEAEPTAGEYALSPLADGTWRLDASPWMCPADAKEIGLAEDAVAAARNAPALR